MGRAILHPELLTYDEIRALHNEHGTVVEVKRVGTPADPIAYMWVWIDD